MRSRARGQAIVNPGAEAAPDLLAHGSTLVLPAQPARVGAHAGCS